MNTLIVEDDKVSTKILANYLIKYGIVTTANSAEEAFAIYNDSAFSSMPYDLICLDLHLPECQGMEFLKVIRDAENNSGISLPLGVKIVIITSQDDDQTKASAQKFGCDSFITKPLNKDSLEKELKRLQLISQQNGD